MPLLIVNILFALISIVLYCFAPGGCSHSFCCLVMMVYLLQNGLWLILSGKKRKLRFELFFMISFFFVNFVYPVFYEPVYPHWMVYIYEFNRHVISQATALAYMAYAFYMLGITDLPREHRPEPTQPSFVFTNTHMLAIAAIACLSFVLFVLSGGYEALASVYSGGGNLRDVGTFSYFNNIFSVSTLLMAALLFQLPARQRWPYLLLLVLFVLIMLSTGSRQFSISIVIILMVCFSLHIYRLRGWQVAVLMLFGATALFLIMVLRKTGLNFSAWHDKLNSFQQVTSFDIFSDLTLNSINLYVLTDWGNTHALTWLHGVLIDLASPIPKLGTWLIHYTGEPSELLNGGDLPSFILLGRNACWGTGTNMVGELYRSFGTVGTCLFMMGLGLMMKEAYYRSNTSIYWYVFYLLMVGHALIYPRAAFVYDPRTVVWALLLLWLIRSAISRYQRVFRKEEQA